MIDICGVSYRVVFPYQKVNNCPYFFLWAFQIIDIEQFISVKGFKALGNQLTGDKLKQISWLKPLEYIVPEEVIEKPIQMFENETIESENFDLDEDGQITMF